MGDRLTELTASAGRLAAPVVGVVAGSGQVARSAVEAGADLLLVLNSGLYRSLGAGSLAGFLPYGNANGQTLELLKNHVLPRACGVPVIAGVLASDPAIELADHLAALKGLGVAGVTNWPAVDFLDGRFRHALEAEGLGSETEVALIRAARAAGLRAFGFTLGPESAGRFVEAGADGLILNLGLTRPVEGVVERRDQLQQAVVRLNAMLRAATRGAGGRSAWRTGGRSPSRKTWSNCSSTPRSTGSRAGRCSTACRSTARSPRPWSGSRASSAASARKTRPGAPWWAAARP